MVTTTACLNGCHRVDVMLILWLIAVFLAILYIFWIGYFYYGWLKTPDYTSVTKAGELPVTIIVPVRNEMENISRLLDSLCRQDYPQYLLEIIIVDDHSTDKTNKVVASYSRLMPNLLLIKSEKNSTGKKQALRKGVYASSSDFILTTDADCLPGRSWVSTMVDCFEKTGGDLIAGAVLINKGKGLLNIFQRLEQLSLVGSSAGSLTSGYPIMCSSANLGFRKDSFEKVDNQVNDNVSSGDDVFFLFALHRSGKRSLHFLKSRSAVVITLAEKSLGSFLNQRRRWASKSRNYDTIASVFTSLLVFLINFYIVIILFSSVLSFEALMISVFLFVFKSIVDFPFLYSLTGYFGDRKLMNYFPVIQFLYFFYISFTVITAFRGTNEWKGRIVRH